MELEIIKNSIHEIRGQKVILDFDLAKMYQVETRISTPLGCPVSESSGVERHGKSKSPT
jgi:hypothetical protein